MSLLTDKQKEELQKLADEVLNEAKLLSPLLINNPAKNTLNFIKSNTDIWKGQHFKLPVLKLSKNIIEEIDNAMSKMV